LGELVGLEEHGEYCSPERQRRGGATPSLALRAACLGYETRALKSCTTRRAPLSIRSTSLAVSKKRMPRATHGAAALASGTYIPATLPCRRAAARAAPPAPAPPGGRQ